MRNDPVGPPSTSKLRRVPLPTNPAQATCLFGPYCCFPIHCPMAHPVSLIKPKGLDSDACLSASLEDEVASAHPELCSDCSKLYAKAGMLCSCHEKESSVLLLITAYWYLLSLPSSSLSKGIASQ
eukprot:1160165-Pelagomonas_calceolata.AAC.2